MLIESVCEISREMSDKCRLAASSKCAEITKLNKSQKIESPQKFSLFELMA